MFSGSCVNHQLTRFALTFASIVLVEAYICEIYEDSVGPGAIAGHFF
jgi:hypothetical protein